MPRVIWWKRMNSNRWSQLCVLRRGGGYPIISQAERTTRQITETVEGLGDISKVVRNLEQTKRNVTKERGTKIDRTIKADPLSLNNLKTQALVAVFHGN